MKELIKNAEDRVLFYRELLLSVHNDTDDYVEKEWFKSFIKEQRNDEQKNLKELQKEQMYLNQGMNSPYLYKIK